MKPVTRLKPVKIRTCNGRMEVRTRCRGLGGFVSVSSNLGGLSGVAEILTPPTARRLSEAIKRAADHQDGGVYKVLKGDRCKCGQRYGLKMVRLRVGHWRAAMGWTTPEAMCQKCRRMNRGIFRYCATK